MSATDTPRRYGVSQYDNKIAEYLDDLEPQDIARIEFDKNGEVKLTNLLIIKLIDVLDDIRDALTVEDKHSADVDIPEPFDKPEETSPPQEADLPKREDTAIGKTELKIPRFGYGAGLSNER